MEGHIKAKVTSSVYQSRSRPGSPTKNYGTSLSPPPILRPKAKVNSSATVQQRRPSSSSSSPNIRATASASATVAPPRAPSPFKLPQSISRNQSSDSNGSSAVMQFKAKVTSTAASRPKSVIGQVSPESRQRALTQATNDRSESVVSQRPRGGSASSPSVSAPLSRGHISSPSSSKLNPSNENGSASTSNASAVGGKGLVRVKSKVSSLADTRPHSPSLPPSPLLPSRPLSSHINRTARVPSISNIKVTPPLAPSSVANSSPGSGTTSPTSPTSVSPSQRFATTRETHTSKHHVFQPFHANDDHAVTYAAYNASARNGNAVVIDPASVPLPPQSPPTSTLSFSSRSSASRSSVSYETQNSSEASRSTAPTLHSRVNGTNGSVVSLGRGAERLSPPMSGLEGLGIKIMQAMADESFEDDYVPERMSRRESSVGDEDDDADLLDRKKRAQAKSNRKIEDLEITNRSLLAINSSLEATKHRQAKEIRDLRRKLRESRLILPPRAYRAVKSSDSAFARDDDEDDDDDDDDENEEEQQAVVEGKTDATYRRVRGLLESLLEEGRRALETKPEDLAPGGKGGAKVLSEEEARTWRGDDMDSHSVMPKEDGDSLGLRKEEQERLETERPLTPSRVAIPDDDDGLDYPDTEDEANTSLVDPQDISIAVPAPNITVTPSPPSP
ncbi:hypothetical protein BXZ70DRAFT_928414 [Cristinia sonorae]|uniref:Uncharacterized protein n=1 Tax=Cristinia sonorae TaxID=1940300 RepID=A0A8K0URF9_9AGAR|nr:hypothetical protein BXZ70DRAFT_928414 [Cristinia sonorae]